MSPVGLEQTNLAKSISSAPQDVHRMQVGFYNHGWKVQKTPRMFQVSKSINL